MLRVIDFVAEDGVEISARLHSAGNRQSCLIFAPGFAQHSGTRTMAGICERLSSGLDVLCLDFRGTGKSRGGFHFGGREYLDILPAFAWVKDHYQRVSLLGLSLGAYSSLRAVVERELELDALVLVSCPTSVDDIVWSGAALNQLVHLPFQSGAFAKERDLFFRWRYPFGKKPRATELARKLRIPASFLVGQKDRLVPESMSAKVYREISGQKNWRSVSGGGHAEDLLIEQASETIPWLLENLA